MSGLVAENILVALRSVRIPETTTNVVDAGMISGVAVRGANVGFLITILPDQKSIGVTLQKACEHAVAIIPGVEKVTAVLTAETKQGQQTVSTVAIPAKKAVWNTTQLPFVRRVIAIASGKGGVGKSTSAVNLAHAFAAQGKRVGLLDADIYGPSLPRMLGVTEKPDMEAGLILPKVAHEILFMSMGLLVGDDSALVWRGPQMSKALHQLLRGVRWGTEEAPLDILFIDMPPGTGDVHLSLAQQIPLNGAIIVTTPQEVAVADARKSIDMFQKVHVPILGIIENMSGFSDPVSGKVYAIFGEGGGKRLANSVDVPLLGQVPIDLKLGIASDTGARFEDSAGIYTEIANRI